MWHNRKWNVIAKQFKHKRKLKFPGDYDAIHLWRHNRRLFLLLVDKMDNGNISPEDMVVEFYTQVVSVYIHVCLLVYVPPKNIPHIQRRHLSCHLHTSRYNRTSTYIFTRQGIVYTNNRLHAWRYCDIVPLDGVVANPPPLPFIKWPHRTFYIVEFHPSFCPVTFTVDLFYIHILTFWYHGDIFCLFIFFNVKHKELISEFGY